MMDQIRKILPFFLGLLLLTVPVMYALGQQKSAETPALPETDQGIMLFEAYYEPTEEDTDTDESDAVLLTEEMLEEEGELSEGTYLLKGTYHKTIVIDAHDKITHLILDQADIRTNDGPGLFVRSAAKVVITVKEGTENAISDCAYYSDKTIPAAIFSYADLSLNGTGSLTVTGFMKDAIYTGGVFKAFDGTLRLKAKRNALHADDGMLLRLSSLSAEAERDGLKTGVHRRTGKGVIFIAGGENKIIAGNTAILSGKDLYVTTCRLSLNAVVSDTEIAGVKYIEEGCL